MPSGPGDNIPPEKRCKATSKQTGEQCGHWKIAGREVCHYHGGKSLVGISHKSLKHGRYSKALPERLRGRYEAALKDEKALVQRDEIAMMEARKVDLLARADTGESGALMAELRKHIRGFRKASNKLQRLPANGTDKERNKELEKRRRELRDEMGEHHDAVFAGIEKADEDYRLWAEIQKVDNLLIRLRESERRHIQEQHEMYSADEVRTMLVAVQDIIKRNVREQGVLQAIATDLVKLEHISTRGAGAEPSVN